MKFIKAAWPFLTSFAVLLACIYNIAFWSVFGLNPLSFLTFNQILLSSVEAFLYITPMLIGGLFGLELKAGRNEMVADGHAKTGRAIDWLIFSFLALFTVIGMYFVFIGDYKWPLFLGGTIALVCAYLLATSPVAEKLNFPHSLLFWGSLASIFFVFLAIFAGFKDADKVVSGREYMAVSKSPCADRYVGAVGDLLVFYGPGNEETKLTTIGSVSELSLFPGLGNDCEVDSTNLSSTLENNGPEEPNKTAIEGHESSRPAG